MDTREGHTRFIYSKTSTRRIYTLYVYLYLHKKKKKNKKLKGKSFCTY